MRSKIHVQQHWIVRRYFFNRVWKNLKQKEQLSYILLIKKVTSANGTLRRKTMEFEQQSLEFAEEVHRIATSKVEDMEKAAIEITSDVDTAVSAHFNTSSMQTTLKTQAEEVFTKFCDEKNPEMINPP